MVRGACGRPAWRHRFEPDGRRSEHRPERQADQGARRCPPPVRGPAERVISSPTPAATCAPAPSTAPAFRTAMARRGLCQAAPRGPEPAPHVRGRRPCRAETARRACQPRAPDAADRETLRHRQGASRCCPADGSSSGPSHGSAAAAVWRGTGKEPSTAPRHGCSSPTSAASPASSQEPEIVRTILNRALRASCAQGQWWANSESFRMWSGRTWFLPRPC